MIIVARRPIPLYILHNMNMKRSKNALPQMTTALVLPEQLAAQAADAVRELLAGGQPRYV